MGDIRISVGNLSFLARLEMDQAPATSAAFRELLPYEQKLIQARWSGEAAWIPLGEFRLGVDFENHTSYPAPGQILFYPGGYSETEILFPYGPSCFGSKMGQLAGNHFITVVDGLDQLPELGRRVVWQGAQDVRFELI